jgi:hypothetical protein
MDGRRFRIEPWNGESENSDQLTGRCFASSGRALFFGSFLLGQQKK